MLQHGQRVNWDGPDFKHESASENERLCRLWDARGFLALFSEPPHPDRCCRIFNAHKNSTTDRQIGDRRWVNGSEYHPTGNKQEVNWPCFRSQRLLPSGKGHSAEGRFQLFAFSFPRFCCFSGIHSLKRSLDQFLEKPMVTDMV